VVKKSKKIINFFSAPTKQGQGARNKLMNLGGNEPPSILDLIPGLTVNGGPHRAEERSTFPNEAL